MFERKPAPAHEMKLAPTGEIEVAFAQLNVVDYDGDVTLPGAFPVKDVPMSAYGHSSWDGAPPVGRGTISEQGDWAVFTGQLFMATTHGHDAYETLKGLGELAEFSYGFAVLDSERGQRDGKAVRVLRSLDPFEVSHVLKGAGVATHLMSLKSGGPGTGLPYADHLSWVRDEVEALFGRTAERAQWRAKEGRQLSAANRAALSAIVDRLRAIGGAADELDALLASTDPQNGGPAAAHAACRSDLLVEIERARSLGVPV